MNNIENNLNSLLDKINKMTFEHSKWTLILNLGS